MSDNPLVSFLDMVTDEIPIIGTIKRTAEKVKVVTDVLGLTEAQAVDMAQNDPTAFIAKLQEKRKVFEAEVADRNGARDMAQETGFTKLHYYSALKSDLYIIAGIVLLCFFHEDNVIENISYMLIGAGITSNERVQNFLFGSSAGSKAKEKVMSLIGRNKSN